MTNLSQLFRASGGSSGADNSSASVSEAADTLIANERVEVAHLIAAGKLRGWVHPDAPLKDVYFDSTPVMNEDGSLNFENVEVEAVWGTQDQCLSAGWNTVASTTAVGVEVRADRPVVRQISDPRITSITVTLGVDAFNDASSGSVQPTAVDLAIYLSTNGGAWTRVGLCSFEGKASSTFNRNYKIALPAGATGPYRVMVQRITADNASSLVADSVYFRSYTALVEYRFKYPLCAVIAVRFPAKSFSSTPTMQFLLDRAETQVPSNYNPTTRTYTGLWDGTFQTTLHSNPAWVVWDFLTDPINGLGRHIPEESLDELKWQLYTIGKYCDEPVSDGFGGTEPRFTFNGTLRDRTQAAQLLADLVGMFRGMAFTSGGQLHVVQDVPEEPCAVFTNANVVDGVFSYTSSARSARYTAATVCWRNPANNYVQELEYVPLSATIPGVIEELGLRERPQVIALGCTSRGQAARVGLYDLLAGYLLDETVTFTPGTDGALVLPGKVIAVHDRHRNTQRLGGRLRACSADRRSVTLDAPVSIAAGADAHFSVMLPDGSLGTVAIDTSAALSGVTLPLMTALPAVPVSLAVWGITIATEGRSLWRVLGVKTDAGRTYEVEALKYDPSLYALVDGLKLSSSLVGNATTEAAKKRPNAVSRIDVELESVRLNPTTPTVQMLVSWPQARNADTYTFKWRRPGESWNFVTQSSTTYTIPNVVDGLWNLAVVSTSVLGQTATTYLDYVVDAAGLRPVPAAVSGLTLSTDGAYVTATWAALADLDVVSYEVRRGGTSWETATLVDRVAGTTCTLADKASGVVTLRVKALNQFGNYSAEAVSASIDLGSPAITAFAGSFSGADYLLSWTPQPARLAIKSVEIRHGASWAAGTKVVATADSNLRLPAQWLGARTFWIAATDEAGTVGTPVSTTLTIAAPGAPTVTAVAAYGHVQLKWELAAGTLPIVKTHVVRSGVPPGGSGLDEAWVTSASTLACVEKMSGDVTYTLTCTDSAGNVGTARAIVVSVPADGGIPQVADASAIVATAGSSAPGGVGYEVVLDAKTGRLATWSTAKGKYILTPTEESVAETVAPALDAIEDLEAADTQLSTSIGQVSARLDSGGDIQKAIVQVQSLATATQGKIAGTWGLTLSAGGAVSGIKAYNDGTTSALRLTSDTVLVSAANLIADAGFYSPQWWGAGSAWPSNAIPCDRNGVAPPRALQVLPGAFDIRSAPISAEPGASYSVRLRIWRSRDFAGTIFAGMHFPGSSVSMPGAATLNSASWYSMSQSEPGLGAWMTHTATTTTSTSYAWFQTIIRSEITAGYCELYLECVRAAGADMIVDGAITTQKIAAKAITAEKLSVNTLQSITATTGNLTANQIEVTSALDNTWGFVRSLGKWLDDGNNGWILARDGLGNTFVEFKGGNSRFWMKSWGDCGISFPKFSVDNNGNASFGGTLSAPSGTLGTITAGYLQNSTNTTSLNLNELGGGELLRVNGVTRVFADGRTRWRNQIAALTIRPRSDGSYAASAWDSQNLAYKVLWITSDSDGEGGFEYNYHNGVSFTVDTGIAMSSITDAYDAHLSARVTGWSIWWGRAPAAADALLIDARPIYRLPVSSGQDWGNVTLHLEITARFRDGSPIITSYGDPVQIAELALSVFRLS